MVTGPGLRVLVNDYCGHPFQAQLSRRLASRGHAVLHAYCSSYVTGRGALEVVATDPASLAFAPIDLGAAFAKHSIVKRYRQERRYGRLLVRAAEEFRPDVIISANNPLFAQRQIVAWAGRRRIRFVYWLQDIISTAMGDELRRRFGLLGQPVAAYLARLEARLLKASDAVVAITSDFRGPLQAWGVAERRISVIENWAPLDEMPTRPRDNAWAREHGLADASVLLYAGTLGLKHDPELLVQLAISTRRRRDTRVVVISEGVGADYCIRRAREVGLDRLLVLPFQSYDRLPEVLATADVLLAILEPEAGVFSVPSKILSYHCAGRPLLASLPPSNLGARVIEQARSGIVVSPGDAAALAAGADQLLDDPALRARLAANARAYAERTFDIDAIANGFEALFSEGSGAKQEATTKGIAHAH